MSFAAAAVFSAIALGAAMLCWWAASVAKRDASIVDIFWGLGFVIVAGISLGGHGYRPRQVLVCVLVGAWGLRLVAHLSKRNLGKGEDPRYAAMRRRRGPSFWWTSLFTVYGLQLVLLWTVSLPIQASMTSPQPSRITVLDVAGTVLWVTGFVFESIGDLQLARFKADAANAGKVMDRGLWRYTRHPNYFGDALLWWGIGLIALSTHRWWVVVGPFVMTVLLLRVSGVPLLERRMRRTRPGYEKYAASTSAFIPLPPRAR